MRAGVGGKRRRKLGREYRYVPKLVDANRDDDPAGADGSPVSEGQPKTPAVGLQRSHQRGIDVGDCVTLKPQPIVHEHGQRDRLPQLLPGGAQKAFDVVAMVGSRQAGGTRCRTQVHAGGHALPECHRRPEDERRNARLPQMRGDREPVGAGANHDGRFPSHPTPVPSVGCSAARSNGRHPPPPPPSPVTSLQTSHSLPVPFQASSRQESWEKGLLTRDRRRRYVVGMPISGVVHPEVYSRWVNAPATTPTSVRPAPRRSEAATAVQPTAEQKPGGTTVSTQTINQVARVLIVDDQTLFRSGLAGLLNDDSRVAVVGQAADGAEAVKQASALKPDVVLMDVKMPNLDGVEATRRIVAEHPEIKILILTTFDADTFVLQALRAGASGYVLKDSQPQAIVSSILAVLSGERVMASAVANRVLDMLTGTTTSKDFYDGLTAREIEILKLMADGQAIEEYEGAFAQAIGVRFGFSFSAGRVGLFGLLQALGIGTGDEVLLQAPTHVVVSNAIRYTGASPVYVDCRLDSFTIDLEQAERRITSRTRVLL